MQELDSLFETLDHDTHEAFVAEYLQKRLQKELPHSGNDPVVQKKVDEGKKNEWNTLLSKDNVIRIHYGKAADHIREKFAHRFIGSRFVVTQKACQEGVDVDPHDPATLGVKARWCLQGHLDP